MEAGLVTVSLLSHPKSSALATGPPYRLCKLVPEHRQADAPCRGCVKLSLIAGLASLPCVNTTFSG